MVVVITAAIFDLGAHLVKELFLTDYGQFKTVIFNIFGLFLNILIPLEILENITDAVQYYYLSPMLI